MTTTSATEYRVVNEIGRVVQTFGGLDAKKCAVAFAKSERDRRGDLTVEELTTTVQTRRVYRPRPAERANAAIHERRALA